MNVGATKGKPAISVAIVDDETAIINIIVRFLRKMDLDLRTYTDPEKCLEDVAKEPPDIVITDLRMPKVEGLAVLERVKKMSPSTDVIIITGNADKMVAIEALRLGAFDFFEKPFYGDQLIETLKRTLRYRQVVKERDQYAEQVSFLSQREANRWGLDAFVGKSPALRAIVDDIKRVQNAGNTSVLITGESGTGKELVARAIHFGGTRSSHPFVPINCCAVSADLAESMLFGHVRGAFTGAISDKRGCFDLADKGTLFLDEIGDMSPILQTKLLRVLEDGVVIPVGKTEGRSVDVRVIASTNVDLKSRIASGAFRLDLYHRLAGFLIVVPSLRERAEDIPLLAKHFMEMLAREMGLASPGISAEALSVLGTQSYPGNVRQLRNVIEQALIQSAGAEIRPPHLRLETVSVGKGASDKALPPDVPLDLPLDLQKAERLLIKRAMTQTGGNVSAAAKLLGIPRTRLYRKLASLGD
jgi:DNA-binding NtrC family response regulator